MNDDFEKHLAAIGLARPPAAWRAQILGKPRLDSMPTTSWLRELLWPCPQAWAGMAALWIVMLTMNWNEIGTVNNTADAGEFHASAFAPARLAELLDEELPSEPKEPMSSREKNVKHPADRPRSSLRRFTACV